MASKKGEWKRTIDNRMDGIFGMTDLVDKTISINRKQHRGNELELLDTIVHEETHARHPRMSEEAVVKSTTKSLKKMSDKAREKMLNRYRR